MDVSSVVAGIWAAVNLGAVLSATGCMIFGAPATEEELDRASMRSMSWPRKENA